MGALEGPRRKRDLSVAPSVQEVEVGEDCASRCTAALGHQTPCGRGCCRPELICGKGILGRVHTGWAAHNTSGLRSWAPGALPRILLLCSNKPYVTVLLKK